MPLSVEVTKPTRMSEDVTAHPPDATDIFSNIGREVGLTDGFDQKILAYNITQNAIEFSVEPDHVHYIQPNRTRVYARFKLLKGDGVGGLANIGADDVVAPVNLLPAALFKLATVRCNDLVVGGTDMNHLAYKTYLETMCSYKGAAETHLKSSFFYPDTPSKFDTNGPGNKGFAARQTLTAGSKYCEFMFPLNLDVLNVDKLFPPGLKLHFQLNLNDPKFYLQSDTSDRSYKIVVDMCYLYIRKIKVSTFLFNKHEQSLLKGDYCRYPYKRNVIKKMFLAENQQSFFWQNAFSGALPGQVFMAMNVDAADHGCYKLNPFNFQHFDLSECSLHVDGREMETFSVDFKDNRTQEMLYSFYENIGIQNFNAAAPSTRRCLKAGLASPAGT